LRHFDTGVVTETVTVLSHGSTVDDWLGDQPPLPVGRITNSGTRMGVPDLQCERMVVRRKNSRKKKIRHPCRGLLVRPPHRLSLPMMTSYHFLFCTRLRFMRIASLHSTRLRMSSFAPSSPSSHRRQVAVPWDSLASSMCTASLCLGLFMSS